MPAISKSRKKYIYLFIRLSFVIIGSTVGSYLLFKDEGWDEFVGKLYEINAPRFIFLLFIALCIFIFGQAVIGIRWWLLLRTQSVYISLWQAIRLHFLGLFCNNFMLGSVGGDVVRAWYVTKHTEHKFEAALSVFVDRVIGLFSTLTIAIVFYIIFLMGQKVLPDEAAKKDAGIIETVSEYKWFIFWIAVVIGFGLAMLLLNSRGRLILKKASASIIEHGKRLVAKFSKAFFVYCRNPLTIILVFLLTVFLQLMTITGFWLVGRELGIELDLRYYYVFFTITWVVGSIPVSFGGLVLVEGFLIFIFVKFGAEKTSATVLAFCQRIVWMLASLPGAAILLFGAHLPKQIDVDYGENMD